MNCPKCGGRHFGVEPKSVDTAVFTKILYAYECASCGHVFYGETTYSPLFPSKKVRTRDAEKKLKQNTYLVVRNR